MENATKSISVGHCKILTTLDVCEQLKISHPTLERWIKKGVLVPVVWVGRTRRWSQDQVDAFLLGIKE
jgi:excisionase family DNA binding protein